MLVGSVRCSSSASHTRYGCGSQEFDAASLGKRKGRSMTGLLDILS